MSVVRIIEGPYFIEVIFTKNVWAFSRDQENCPYEKGVRKESFDCICICCIKLEETFLVSRCSFSQ